MCYINLEHLLTLNCIHESYFGCMRVCTSVQLHPTLLFIAGSHNICSKSKIHSWSQQLDLDISTKVVMTPSFFRECYTHWWVTCRASTRTCPRIEYNVIVLYLFIDILVMCSHRSQAYSLSKSYFSKTVPRYSSFRLS